MGGKKFDTFNLSEMGSLAKSEQIPCNKLGSKEWRYSSLRTFCCLTFPLGSSRKLVRMAADSFCITAPTLSETLTMVYTLVCDCLCGSDRLDERLESAHRQRGERSMTAKITNACQKQIPNRTKISATAGRMGS